MFGRRPALVLASLVAAGASIALLHCGSGVTLGTASFGGDTLDASTEGPTNDATADAPSNDGSSDATTNLDGLVEGGPAMDASDSANADATDGPSDAVCTANTDCVAGSWCLYKIGDCSTKGRCLSPSSLGAMCNAVVSYCGCDGKRVGGLCGPPYAFGPTLGRLGAPCGDSGM